MKMKTVGDVCEEIVVIGDMLGTLEYHTESFIATNSDGYGGIRRTDLIELLNRYDDVLRQIPIVKKGDN